MRALVCLLASVFGVTSLAQGTLRFETRVPGQVDAPVLVRLDPFSPPIGPGAWSGGAGAQLFIVTGSGASLAYTALSPATTFQNSSPAAAFYVEPVSVSVPLPAGSQWNVVMRAWLGGTSFGDDRNVGRGESAPLAITLGPEVVLTGLQSFSIVLPEPIPSAVFALGAFLLARRRTDSL